MKTAIDFEIIRSILRAAKASHRTTLNELEGLQILEAAGIRTPKRALVNSEDELMHLDLTQFSGTKVVLKIVSHHILHKSDVGGVAVIEKTLPALTEGLKQMKSHLRATMSATNKNLLDLVSGFSINEYVVTNTQLGSELLLGLRWTADFGPVVTFGPGGLYAEFLSKQLKPGHEVAVLSPELGISHAQKALETVMITPLLTEALRGQKPLLAFDRVQSLLETFLSLAKELSPELISEFEVNPLVVSSEDLIALDALVKISEPPTNLPLSRPLHKISKLLCPASVGIIGVAGDQPGAENSPGRVILRNLLRDGFAQDKITVIKPGAHEILGCHCEPDLDHLPETLDLMVLVVSASLASDLLIQIIDKQKAHTVILIPGGLEEKSGTQMLVTNIKESLNSARSKSDGGPLINGGNCLGVRSLPGKINTLFIPEYKLPFSNLPEDPLALISQSGAFAIARLNRLTNVNPLYTITVGNQMDLTLADYLEFLSDDPKLKIYAVYVEGFKPGDGVKFLRVAQKIKTSGKTLILYRAGRTQQGAEASASHTASIAGDDVVTRSLCEQVGVLLADSIEDFEDLIALSRFFLNRPLRGKKLGAISNAGFECVAIADRLGSFKLTQFSTKTQASLSQIFQDARLDTLVDIHNPLDLTPMCGDESYTRIVRNLLESPEVDLALVGIVPLTPALNSLPRAEEQIHAEDMNSSKSLAPLLIELFQNSQKPWFVIVDSGTLYDPFVQKLQSAGIPCFRTVDRLLRLLNFWN